MLAGACGSTVDAPTETAREESVPAVELLPLPDGLSFCAPSDSSADGSVVVGSCFGGGEQRSTKWVRGEPVTLLDVDGYTQASAVSADGSVIIGSIGTDGEEGYVYDTELRGRVPVAVHQLSDDGSIVAGAAFGERNNWDTVYALRGRRGDGNLERLAPLERGRATMVNDLSGDGRVAVGYVTDVTGVTHAASWSADGTLRVLEGFPGAVSSEAVGVNRDGSVIAGYVALDADRNVTYPVRWGAAGVERLGTDSGTALDVSADGRRIIVQFSPPDNTHGLWQGGAVERFDSLFSPRDFGRSEEHSLSAGFGVWGITSDGRSVFGISQVGDVSQVFVARLAQ